MGHSWLTTVLPSIPVGCEGAETLTGAHCEPWCTPSCTASFSFSALKIGHHYLPDLKYIKQHWLGQWKSQKTFVFRTVPWLRSHEELCHRLQGELGTTYLC